MKTPVVYLKSNVVIEPLVGRWYAWSHLISPATAAMNIVGRHIPIVDSYITAPKVHAEAVKNPKMKGGHLWYICTDCRAFVTNKHDKPVKCNYDPYTNVWGGGL